MGILAVSPAPTNRDVQPLFERLKPSLRYFETSSNYYLRGAMTTQIAGYAENINQAWNSHDIERVIRFYSPEYIGDDIGLSSPLRGRDGIRTKLHEYWTAFPDLRFEVISTLVDGNRLVIVWSGEGTHQGTIMRIPPTWHKVQVRGVSILDVQDGMVVHGQHIWDMAGMLRHMGLLPEL
jgi:steroid delta-isomerase-like uncharacterized protein